ncbi:4Fe-4S dicluster domain-containing protein [Christensenellaceae bacterium NSJ-44]|uniref:4Fe-4S dicluster domain-containing protein n=1 Tax=Luoshenia tenuis TaxID=2763654 RepID=A0A926CXM1_9FIRM|nr:4Fe-4S dicluster domain-containing protein [Luoshenia tenuis]MBC8528580.1 4Fe-4S dicluster domain-containing protein [Luoshenia tenuis]
MKRIYVNEKWCLGCHLCEYNCAFANSGKQDMVDALKGKKIYPRIQIEEGKDICFAVSCRHCEEPLCVKSCISGAMTRTDGVIHVDQDKCVGCYTCVMACPYGAVMPGPEGSVVQKCELCLQNSCGAPACVAGCPNNAICYEER